MRHHWLLLSYLGILLWAAPANAGTLVSWGFDSGQNQLTFTTDKRVKPKAKLIQNPTRLVIDLPQTTITKPYTNQNLSGPIKSVRVGQPEPQMARIVVELAPGYTLDPQKLEIRGTSPTQWMVKLPTPQRTTVIASDTQPQEPAPLTPLLTPSASSASAGNNRSVPNNNLSTPDSRYIQVTRNGLFINLDSKNGDKITVVRQEKGIIDVNLIGVTLPEDLKARNVLVNNYGVEQIQFNQVSGSPNVTRLSLKVSEDSPDWDGAITKLGGVILWPKGGTSSLARGSNISPTLSSSSNSRPQNDSKVTITKVELSQDNTSLLVRSDQKLNVLGNWNRDTQIYEIKIPNSKLADNFNSPDLGDNSPISRLRIRQDQSSGNVLILIKPALGVSFNDIQQPSDNLVSLQIRELTALNRSLTPLAVPPELPSSSALTQTPRTNTSTSTLDRAWQRISPKPGTRQRNGKLVVVIDPGHGGQDPGAVGIGGLREKDVIMPISDEVSRILEKQGIQVIMTRDSDNFVSLDGRTKMANRADADLFVSIHANSMGMKRPDINGLETYYFDSGRELAQTIHRNILRRLDVPDRRVRRARFYVLRKSLMPSVLVEVGFVTGDKDSVKLANPAYRRRMAEAIASGILEYIQNKKL